MKKSDRIVQQKKLAYCSKGKKTIEVQKPWQRNISFCTTLLEVQVSNAVIS